MVRNKILGLFLLIVLDSLGMSSQMDEAESMMVDLLEAEAAFPTRYAVECVLEAQIPSPEGLVTWNSKQWFARDAKMELISVVAEQEMHLNFAAKEHDRVVMWMKGLELQRFRFVGKRWEHFVTNIRSKTLSCFIARCC